MDPSLSVRKTDLLPRAISSDILPPSSRCADYIVVGRLAAELRRANLRMANTLERGRTRAFRCRGAGANQFSISRRRAPLAAAPAATRFRILSEVSGAVLRKGLLVAGMCPRYRMQGEVLVRGGCSQHAEDYCTSRPGIARTLSVALKSPARSPAQRAIFGLSDYRRNIQPSIRPRAGPRRTSRGDLGATCPVPRGGPGARLGAEGKARRILSDG